MRTAAMICFMSPELAETLRHEHNRVVEAVHRVQARALHVGGLLLEVRDELGTVVWNYWIENGCPIPAGAARRYVNEAKKTKTRCVTEKTTA